MRRTDRNDRRPLASLTALRGRHALVVDSSRIRQELGWKEELSLAEAMRATVAADLTAGLEPADPTRFELGFDLAFHERVRAGFLALASAEPSRFAIVDGRPAADDVWAAIRAIVDERRGVDSAAGEPDPAAERIHQ